MPQPIAFQSTTVAQVAVTDFDRAVEFFTKHLGFEVDYAMPEMGWGEIRTNVPGLTIGVNRDPENAGKGANNQLIFSVVDIDAARGELEAAGIRFDGPNEEVPGMVMLATFLDPDGNRYRLAQTLGQPPTT